MAKNRVLLALTVVPEAPSAGPERAVRDVASVVDGRLALVARLGATVVDEPVAVDGREAREHARKSVFH